MMKKPAAKTRHAKAVDDHLAAAPMATEGISYGMVIARIAEIEKAG